ncbi:MAG: hypothetical protein AAB337_02425 [Patescibacteria group bacterium]
MVHTVHLSEALERIEHDVILLERANQTLIEWEHEPLIASMFETQQTPPHHCEGKTVRSHVQRILFHLYAIVEGKLSLMEIEEFARHKELGYEIQELEETVRENAATFEVFALLHDIGKPFRANFDKEGRVHYIGHEKEIYRPEVMELISRMATRYRLTDDDVNYLVPLISLHLEPLKRCSRGVDPKHINFFTRFAVGERLDPDDFINLLLGGTLLDQTLGSIPAVPQHLVNVFLSELAYAPWKTEERAREKALARKRDEQNIFHEVGLDGAAVMKLTGMRPSRDLGELLKALQATAKGTAPMDKQWSRELQHRVQEAKERL